jgi:hypothetical protein
MFYDVVHRNGVSLSEWLPQLLDAYRSLCADAELPVPGRIAFRPGGWDCGSTAEEQQSYLAALHDAGISLHSGDSHGTYGTWSYHINSRFGETVYRLRPGLVEVAPCWALQSGAGPLSPQFVAAYLRLLHQPVSHRLTSPGAFVVVLHFDHLFHRGWRSSLEEFSVRSAPELQTRIERTLGLMARLGRVLRLNASRLEDV